MPGQGEEAVSEDVGADEVWEKAGDVLKGLLDELVFGERASPAEIGEDPARIIDNPLTQHRGISHKLVDDGFDDACLQRLVSIGRMVQCYVADANHCAIVNIRRHFGLCQLQQHL